MDMRTFTSEKYAQMQAELAEIARSADNELQRSERSYQVVKDSMEELKGFIIAYEFKDTGDEIMFFKEIKPKFLCELLYFREVFYIEVNRPVGNRDMISDYYRQFSERIRIFFERNQLLYAYYRSGKTNDDALFFTRDSGHPLLLQEDTPDLDTRFCTVNSFKLGKIRAYEQLNTYLQGAVGRLENPTIGNSDGQTEDERPDVTWTDAKVTLIELGYAIFSKGSVNNGNADIRLIMAALEYAFNINLGNYYTVFNQNICIRKRSSRTLYLDQLREFLERRMDEADEYPRLR